MKLLKLTDPMMKSSQILDAQKKLQSLGFYKGNLDSIFGKQTQSAVKKFQQEKGIASDGIVGPDTYEKLGISQGSEEPRSEHFKMSEFKCKDGTDVPPEYWNNLQSLMNMLEKVRSAYGNVPVTIMSGYRTPSYNKKVEGAQESQHLYAAAADIQTKDISAEKMYEIADKTVGDSGGVGKYSYFTHVDVRGHYSRW